MTTAELRQHPWRLTRYDRAMLFGGGELRFRPGSAPIDPSRKVNGRKLRKVSASYGSILTAAREFLAHPGGLTLVQFAAKKGLGYDSLKAALWKARKEREEAA